MVAAARRQASRASAPPFSVVYYVHSPALRPMSAVRLEGNGGTRPLGDVPKGGLTLLGEMRARCPAASFHASGCASRPRSANEH